MKNMVHFVDLRAFSFFISISIFLFLLLFLGGGVYLSSLCARLEGQGPCRAVHLTCELYTNHICDGVYLFTGGTFRI